MSEKFKVGINQVKQAKALLAEAPDLAAQVEACALSLAAAYEQLQIRRLEATPSLPEKSIALLYRSNQLVTHLGKRIPLCVLVRLFEPFLKAKSKYFQ